MTDGIHDHFLDGTLAVILASPLYEGSFDESAALWQQQVDRKPEATTRKASGMEVDSKDKKGGNGQLAGRGSDDLGYSHDDYKGSIPDAKWEELMEKREKLLAELDEGIAKARIEHGGKPSVGNDEEQSTVGDGKNLANDDGGEPKSKKGKKN